jgi:hypothetical protein
MTEKEMLNIIKDICDSPGPAYVYNGYEAMKMAIKLLEEQISKNNIEPQESEK